MSLPVPSHRPQATFHTLHAQLKDALSLPLALSPSLSLCVCVYLFICAPAAARCVAGSSHLTRHSNNNSKWQQFAAKSTHPAGWESSAATFSSRSQYIIADIVGHKLLLLLPEPCLLLVGLLRNFIWLLNCPPVCLCICPSVHLSVCSSVCVFSELVRFFFH